MKDKDKIRLAEFVGGPRWEAYIDPANHPEQVDLPDPFTDASDANAVRMHLIAEGWHIEERWEPVSEISSGGYYAEIWHPVTEIHERIDCDYDIWMKWFSNAALKALK